MKKKKKHMIEELPDPVIKRKSKPKVEEQPKKRSTKLYEVLKSNA